MKEHNEIDSLFQSSFEGFELTVDPSVKQNIDRAIASKKKRRRFLFILFPFFFGTLILAAIRYYQPYQGETTSKQHLISHNGGSREKSKLNSGKTNNKKVTRTETSGNKDQTKSGEINFNPKSRPTQNFYLRTVQPKNTKTPSSGKSDFFQNSASAHHGNANETADNLIAKTNELLPKKTERSTRTDKIDNQDSITAITPSDSSQHINLIASTDEPVLLPVVKKEHLKWSLSLVAGWEKEPKKTAERFDGLEPPGTPKEFAQIQNNSFYGKAEFNRRINARFSAIIGLGFRSSHIRQYGSLYSLDSFYVEGSISSAPPPNDSVVYYTKHQAGMQDFRINSVIIPIGIAYSIPVNDRFGIRISAGTELTYGWLSKKQADPLLSNPHFTSLAGNIWLRPEVGYTFGKHQLFAFGTFNQPLTRQLKWDFRTARNPAFGAGIGLYIEL